MPTTQTTKRRTAATKRSTTAKKAAGTRARRSAAQDVRQAQATARRRASSTRRSNVPVVAQAEFVAAQASNAAQTGVTAVSKLVAGTARRLRSLV